jgi:hypothetical protein
LEKLKFIAPTTKSATDKANAGTTKSIIPNKMRTTEKTALTGPLISKN